MIIEFEYATLRIIQTWYMTQCISFHHLKCKFILQIEEMYNWMHLHFRSISDALANSKYAIQCNKCIKMHL